MRVLALVLLFVVGWSPSADAEKAKAKEAAKVYNRAGERGKVVIKLKAGQVMRIDRKEGRWYKVRVSGRTGWIPRSKVELLEEEMVRNTRRRPFVDGRSVKRGFGGEGGPDDRIGADAVGDGDDPVEDDKPKGKGGGDDEEEDDEGDKPKPKASKPKPKPKAKPVVKKGSDDDEEDEGDTEGDEPSGDDDDEGAEIKDDRPRGHVKKETIILSEADPDSEESFTADPDMVLFPTGKKKGKYIEVETDEGDQGFVLASQVKIQETDVEDDEEDGGGGRGERQIDLRGRLGVTIIQQGMRTSGTVDGGAANDNYNLSTSAATIALGGMYLRPYGKAYVIGGEVAMDIAKAIPGVKAPQDKTIGITVYDVNVRAMFGKDLKRKSGMMVFGRLGFRYYSYQVANVGNLMENTAALPSEIVKAPTIGGALAIPRLTDKIGLRFSLDAMVIAASMEQTKGLEDGESASAKGVCAGVGLTYKWKPAMDISATYDLNYTKYAFGAPLATSMRAHTGTDVNRTDVFHAVTVGVAKAF